MQKKCGLWGKVQFLVTRGPFSQAWRMSASYQLFEIWTEHAHFKKHFRKFHEVWFRMDLSGEGYKIAFNFPAEYQGIR